MSDPSAVPSALGIEAVEWIAEGGENLTVRVTGRWRRRRPAWSGKPTLVVEAPGRRYRFPAMPEPPSLTGAGPGMWRISFTVPAALAPELGGRSWLQFGSVAVPLPAAIEPPGAAELAADTEAAARMPPWPGSSESEYGEPSVEPWDVEAEVGEGTAPPIPDDGLILRAEEAEAAVTALTGVVGDLERDLASARARAEELAAEVGVQRGERRDAQQREHAERALRLDLARQLAVRNRDAERARQVYGELAAAESRVRELETQLQATRRRIDEAEQAAAAATTARERAEQAAEQARREAAEASARSTARISAAEDARLAFEAGMEAAREAISDRVPDEPAVPAAPVDAAAAVTPSFPVAAATAYSAQQESGDRPGATALVAALRAELDTRAGAEASLRGRVLDAESRLAARDRLSITTAEVLAALRRELDGLRVALTAEREARLSAERRTAELEQALGSSRARSRDALTAISELRGALANLTPQTPPTPPEGRSAVQPERLTEALARLREQVTPPEDAAAPRRPATAVAPTRLSPPSTALAAPVPTAAPSAQVPAPTGREWLRPIFRALVRADPDRAGRLLVALLPAQRAVIAEPIAYDLLLGAGEEAIRVTAGDERVQVVTGKPARPASDVAFAVIGDHAGLARMLLAGPLRRRWGRGVARIRGRRAAVSALEALVATRLGLAELHRLGVRLEPRTAMDVVAGLIDPSATRHESFTLAYGPPGDDIIYLLIRAGARPEVTTVRPEGRVAVTVTGGPGALEQVVAGVPDAAAHVAGDEWSLAQLRKWIQAGQRT